jgi:hypothetical protein
VSEQPDIRKMGAKLRLQMCTLLGRDPNKLSPADEILVARVGSLKLLVSDIEAAQLRGEKIDLSTYVEASRELEQALRFDHTELSTAEGQERIRAELQDKLRAIIGVPRKDDPDAELSEIEQLRQRVAELEEENVKLRWGDLPSSPEQAASESTPQTPVPSPENVVPFAPVEPQYHSTRTPDQRPPAHYLRDGQPREPWCDTGGGTLGPAYFPLDPTGQR